MLVDADNLVVSVGASGPTPCWLTNPMLVDQPHADGPVMLMDEPLLNDQPHADGPVMLMDLLSADDLVVSVGAGGPTPC
jgi:N-acetylmuramic acid 6-phosphate (MurNAc-6-P) etherase